MQHPTLFSVQKDHLLLTRSVKGRMRYYLLKIEETLFGEYLLEKVYGSMSHKKPMFTRMHLATGAHKHLAS